MPNVAQGAAPLWHAQAAGQPREPGCTSGVSGMEASVAQLVPAGLLRAGCVPWHSWEEARNEDLILAGSPVLRVASGPWCRIRFTENNLFNIKNNFLQCFGWRQTSTYSPGNSNKSRAGAQPGGRVLGGRVHPGLGPASGSLAGLWHDVSIYLLEMFEQEMLMVWVCGDSWRGPAGAAGKERLHCDGAAQQERGNWCHWHCQWGCVPSVLGLEDPTGDETGEGPNGSVASSFAADCSHHCKMHGHAPSMGLLLAHGAAACAQ